jgi:hypothetical protein
MRLQLPASQDIAWSCVDNRPSPFSQQVHTELTLEIRSWAMRLTETSNANLPKSRQFLALARQFITNHYRHPNYRGIPPRIAERPRAILPRTA